MTDKEMPEFAAKAAGIVLEWQDGGWAHCLDTGREWNPRDNNADALWLAVRLCLRVMPQEKCVYVETDPDSLLAFPSVSVLEMNGSDPCAGVRLAIARAAAEIGKGMKGPATRLPAWRERLESTKRLRSFTAMSLGEC